MKPQPLYYNREFPDCDFDIRSFQFPGWCSSSWHNNVCPSVYHDDAGLEIFIDYRNPVLRESYPHVYPRFSLYSMEHGDPLAQTDSLETVFTWLRFPLSTRSRYFMSFNPAIDCGFHQFRNPETGESYGSFEVFEADSVLDSDMQLEPGFYWWSCFPGCLPDGDPIGPFITSTHARWNAQDTI